MLQRRVGTVLAHEAIGFGHRLELGDPQLGEALPCRHRISSFRLDGKVAVVVDERTSQGGSATSGEQVVSGARDLQSRGPTLYVASVAERLAKQCGQLVPLHQERIVAL